MGGEVVLGGQQDRTLGRDTIVLAGKRDVPVTVFCVEHGRWTGRSEFEASAPTVASAEIRASAQNGEFYAAREAAGVSSSLGQASGSGIAAGPGGRSAGSARGDVAQQAAGSQIAQIGRANRMAARIPANAAEQASRSNSVGDAQQKVWAKVAEKNARLKTESSTGSYRRALSLAGGDARKSVPAYVTALSSSLGSDPHLVGVVAAINGKVVAADLFADPALFRKLWPKLLRSYASDAVEHAPEEGKKAPFVTAGKAKEFLLAATDAKSKIENRSDVGSTVRYESSQAVSYSLVPTAKPGAAPGGLGGYSGALHTGVLGK